MRPQDDPTRQVWRTPTGPGGRRFRACEHGGVSATRLVTLDDAPILADLIRVSRDFLAPWEPVRNEGYFTVDGQRAVIRDALTQQVKSGPA